MKKSKRSKSIKKRQSINIKLSDVTTLSQIITNSKIVGKKATAISAVYASIAAISDTISTLPLNLYRLNDKKREIAHDHYLQKIIKFRPNDHLTSVSFLEAIIKNMLTYGNAFIYPIKKRDESIVRLEIIPPENITIFSYEKKPFYKCL